MKKNFQRRLPEALSEIPEYAGAIYADEMAGLERARRRLEYHRDCLRKILESRAALSAASDLTIRN